MAVILRILFIVTAGVGVWGASALTINHMETGAACPSIGPAPICVIVLAGYVAILSSVFLPQKLSRLLFLAGWIPVALLAAFGVVLEITQGDVCPKLANGIPQCFLSAALAIVILGLRVVLMKRA